MLKKNDFVLGSILLSLLFEISMKSSDSLFDLKIAGFIPISWVKLFPVAHGLNFLFISGSIFHLKYVCHEIVFDLDDSYSPARI